jgi:hypothetical protein
MASTHQKQYYDPHSEPHSYKRRSTYKGRAKSGVRSVRTILYWLAIGVAALVAGANTIPYIKAVDIALFNIFDLDGWIGVFANPALSIAAIPMGILLWAFIQTAETYPILLKHDRKVMRLIALEAESSDYMDISDDDDPALASLKYWYNRFPTLGIRTANRAALVAYLVDTAICVSIFPPVDGGIDRLIFVIFTGQWGLVNWGSVALILTMLFCFEFMVRLVLFLGMQYHVLKRAHSL